MKTYVAIYTDNDYCPLMGSREQQYYVIHADSLEEAREIALKFEPEKYGKWQIIPRGDIGERMIVYVTSKTVG